MSEQLPDQIFPSLPPELPEAAEPSPNTSPPTSLWKQAVGRGALALSMAITGGAGIGTATEMLESPPAAMADTGGYPDWNKVCVVGNPADPNSSYGKSTGTGYWCNDYSWGDFTYNAQGQVVGNKQNSSRLYGYRNCTDWVAWRVQNAGVGTVPSGWGDGGNWDNAAIAAGKTVDNTPEPGDIAVWDPTTPGGYGHVAFVEEVGTGTNAGKVRVSEYNQQRDGNYRNDRWVIANHYIDLNGTGVGINGELISGSGGGSTPPPAPIAHYADYTIYRFDTNTSTGLWYAKSSSHLDPTPVWGWAHGSAGDKPIVGDFDGDGYDDYGIYRVSNGTGYWYVRSGGSGQPIASAWGVAHGGWNQDIPIAGDFDGDGKADFGIYRMESDSTGRWYVKSSKPNNPNTPVWGWAHGSPGDIPVVGDFNGDNVDDYGIYRLNPNDSTGYWYVRNGGDGSPTPVWGWVHGSPGDKPIVGDFNGDNVDDYGVYRSAAGTGRWYVRSGGDGNQITAAWDVPHGGWSQDVPLAGDFGRN